MTTETSQTLTHEVTEENFQKFSEGDKPLFLDFWATWCGPCKVMEPVVEKLAQKYAGRITFGKVNVDKEMSLSSRYQILSIPTFIVFKKGQPMDAAIGAVGEASLDQLLSRALNGRSA